MEKKKSNPDEHKRSARFKSKSIKEFQLAEMLNN